MQELQAIGIGGLVTGLALVTCHVALWGKLHPIWSYTIGVLCLNAGATVAAAILNLWMVAVVAWTMALIGGGTVVTCWWVRGQVEHWKQRDRDTSLLLEMTKDAPAGKRRT